MMKNKLLVLPILLLLILFFVACDTTKTIVTDSKDDYIECVSQGLDDFRFSTGGLGGHEISIRFTEAFKEYYVIITDNCKELYKK